MEEEKERGRSKEGEMENRGGRGGRRRDGGIGGEISEVEVRDEGRDRWRIEEI